MSLQAWEWEEDDRESVTSFYQAAGELDAEELARARAWAPESDSDDYSSLGSAPRPAALGCDAPHVVPCTFVASLAFPVIVGHKGKYTSFIDKYKTHPKVDSGAVRARRFYHVEYFLLPDDGEPKNVDILMFPAVAKVFLESGVKTVKPWREGDKLWVSWSQSFSVSVTKELLKKMNFHRITFRLWDTRDRISKKVRHYQMKSSSHLDDAGSFEEVRYLVLNQKRLSEVGIEKANTVEAKWSQEDLSGKQEKAEKYSKSSQGSHQGEPETSSKNSEEYEKSLKVDDVVTSRRNTSRPPGISLAGTSIMEMKELIERSSLSSLMSILERQRSQIKGRDSEGKRKIPRRGKKPRAVEEAEPRQAGPRRQSVFSLQLAVTPLLAGWHTVMSRGSAKSANILDCLLTLKTEVPIMTEEQKQDLNPLTIKIKCASCLPSQPVPIHELERLCTPVYCRYQFHETPVHETEGEPHGTHVRFQDINVIFLGALHPSDLREYLEGPPMVVEVHDRDRKPEEYSRKPSLFGEDPLDSHLNLQVLIFPKETENNPFESQNKMWDTYGVARVSFADLLLGHKYLNLTVPIHTCEPSATRHSQDGRGRKAVGSRGPTDVLQHSPLPAGNYVDANSVLKLRVDIAVPLGAGVTAPDIDLTGNQFGRIIFMFDSKKPLLMRGLLHDITAINAKALELDGFPTATSQQILSAFKMRVKIQDQPHLDVLTGFHLLDGKMHLFILEGLADHGLRRLWDSHEARVPTAERGAPRVLYDSRLRFGRRLYADLDAALQHMRLARPLSQLARDPALYVRGAAPRGAAQALARIYDICRHSTRLREVIARDLLPSSAMVKALSQKFGVPVSREQLTDREPPAEAPQPPAGPAAFRSRTSALAAEVRAHLDGYLRRRDQERRGRDKDKDGLVQKNIREAYQVAKKPPTSRAKVLRISPPTKAVHNYSVQTLNSVVLAKNALYQAMAKEPGRRFAYSQNYLSAMVEPQDPEEEERKAQRASRQAWLTAGGFQVWGLRSSLESQHRDLGLPPLREPKEEWKENELFANVLKPVLDRERWGWDQRHVDFDLYTKPPPVLELPRSPAPKPRAVSEQTRGRKILAGPSPKAVAIGGFLEPPATQGPDTNLQPARRRAQEPSVLQAAAGRSPERGKGLSVPWREQRGPEARAKVGSEGPADPKAASEEQHDGYSEDRRDKLTFCIRSP